MENDRKHLKGEPLGTTGKKYIYRARSSKDKFFNPMDYVTLSYKFALEHAQHQAAVTGEDQIIIMAYADKNKIFQAPNTSEYFYDDEQPLEGKIVKVIKALQEKKKKKGDRCIRIAKRKYDVWPSAYASGAVVKCRQGKIWKGISEQQLEEIIEQELDEAVYSGNMGAMEVFRFMQEAPSELVDQFDKLLRADKETEAWDVVKRFTGAELKGIGTPGSSGSVEEEKKPDFKKEKESGLHGWFSRQGGKGKSKGWVDCNTCRKDKKTGKKTCKTCGRKEGEKRSKYPACRPKPSDCGSSGKGKDWGKKSSKKESLQIDKELIESIISLVIEEMENR